MIVRSCISIWLMLAAAGMAPAAASDLVVTSWGGAYERSQINAYGVPFEKKTGTAITWETYQGGLEQISDQVESGDIVWDIVDVFAHDARVGCEEGLFEKLPESFYSSNRIDEDLLIARPNDCVGPNILWSWVTAYDVRAFADGVPQTISDFFDLERFPGKRAISVYPQANLEMALVADGVRPDRVYEVLSSDEGVERAFRKLSQLRGSLEFWSAGEEPVEMLRNGDVAMATAYSGRTGAAALEGDTLIRTVFDGQVVEEEWLVVVKDTPRQETAIEFLAHVAEPRQQAEQAKWIPYGPMRRTALDLIEQGEPWFHTGKRVLPYLPTTTTRLNRSVISNPAFWAENSAALSERFATWRRSLGY